MPRESTDIYQRNGLVRERMDCHSCQNSFIATINFDLNGNHVIECPWCHHNHFRVIKDGHVTEDRYSSDPRTGLQPDTRSMWKSTTQPIQTHQNTHSFLRDRWLNRSDQQ